MKKYILTKASVLIAELFVDPQDLEGDKDVIESLLSEMTNQEINIASKNVIVSANYFILFSDNVFQVYKRRGPTYIINNLVK